MIRISLVSLCLLVLIATTSHGQGYKITTKKVDNLSTTEITPVQPPPPLVAPDAVKPPALKGVDLSNAEAESVLKKADLWLDARKFIDDKGLGWKLVYGDPDPKPSMLPGWRIRLQNGKQIFVTTEGKRYCYIGPMDADAYRGKLGKEKTEILPN